MQKVENNKVLVQSLIAMRNSLLSSYEMKTHVKEEGLLIRALHNREADYIVFSDYRRNEGRRRIEDALEVIDSAVLELESNCKQAPRIYLTTLKAVARLSKMATVLEYSILQERQKEKIEGIVAL